MWRKLKRQNFKKMKNIASCIKQTIKICDNKAEN